MPEPGDMEGILVVVAVISGLGLLYLWMTQD